MMEVKTDTGFFTTVQQQELDAGALYGNIARKMKRPEERETLLAISKEEYRHAAAFTKYSGKTLKPRRLFVSMMTLLARVLGYTFSIKRLEKGEDGSIAAYRSHIDAIPELKQILSEEEEHEQKLVAMLDEERLHYVGDMVLGMNDALVELTGALAGYTLAMQNTGIIAMAGLITGISATLSMTASGYLSSREAGEKNPAKSSTYTGVAYLITVALLILPFLLAPANSYFVALGITLTIALLIIAGFNYFTSVVRERPFRRNFLTMAAISLGVAAVSFVVGIIVKNVLGINL